MNWGHWESRLRNIYVSSWRGKAELNVRRIGDDSFLIGLATTRKHGFTLIKQSDQRCPV
jgi:hypothetical protein